MAAILIPTKLTVLGPSTLKHPPSIAESTSSLPPIPTSVVWSPESHSIFISSATEGIIQYDLTTGSFQDIPSTSDQCTDPYVSLLCKDRGTTLIYGRGRQVTVLSTQTGKTSQTYDTHKAAITSLSLSNDATLLASTSAHAIHVHNLTLSSHTVLRGLPSGSGTISTCAFHPHLRTRLLVGVGAQLLVYDTTRPSGPMKTIPMDKDQKNVGSIVGITCSPFSKTLVAVACSGGMIGLVDLEKDKGLFRTVSMPAPLTCLSFSAEGAALYAGTENGKFLLLDLRTLDKPPKSVTVSENGDRVIAISVQKKLKAGEAQPVKPAATTAPAKALVQRDTNKAAPGARRAGTSMSATTETKNAGEAKAATKAKPSTLNSITTTGATPRRATGRSASGPGQARPSPTGRVVSGTKRASVGTTKPVPTAKDAVGTKAFSPPKVPVLVPDKDQEEQDGDLSVQINNLLALPKGKELASGPGDNAAPQKGISALSRASSRAHISESAKTRTHSRTTSTSSGVTAESASAGPPRLRSASSSSMASRTSKLSARTVSTAGASSASPPTAHQRRCVSGTSVVSCMSRTPSPDLPDMDDMGPVTPIPAFKVKGKERALGLGTPDVDEWVKAGEGKAKAKDGGSRQDGKHVGFAEDSDSEPEEAEHENEHVAAAPRGAETIPSANGRLSRPELAMQVSPRRSFAGGARGSTSWAPVPSPLRNPAAPPSPQARAAQDMLQAVLRDALHDFRQETKGEIVGLHLDLIRMGAGWRHEMREAMGDFAEEMRALREENARLREENERLRRGY